MQPRGRKAQNDVANLNLFGGENLALFDHSGCGAGDVILIGTQQAWMLCRLPSNQCDIDLLAGIRNAANDVCDSGWFELSAGDVVGHEQALGSRNDNVINHHANQVLADGVVFIYRLGNGDLGADPIGRGCQDWVLVVL